MANNAIANGTKVLYAGILCTIIGKTEGGAVVVQGIHAGQQFVANVADITLL